MKTRKQRFNQLKSAWWNDMPACVIELSRNYLKDYPKDDGAWLFYGISLSQLGRYDEARRAFQRAIKYSSKENLQYPYSRMGQLFDRKGDLRQASDWFRKCVELEPGHATYLIFLGSALANQGQLEEAERCFRKATKCREGCIDEAFYNLAVILIGQEKYKEAEKCLEKAIEIDPKYKLAKTALKDVRKVRSLNGGGLTTHSTGAESDCFSFA